MSHIRLRRLYVRDVNGDGLLQFGELMMAGDVIVLAAPDIGGLPYWVTCLVAVGGTAAVQVGFVSTLAWVCGVAIGALSCAILPRSRPASPWRHASRAGPSR